MGYTYVMSDIHGMGELLENMLEKLSFSEEDTLYILGDMIDRGPDPAKVLDIASSRGNIIPLRGNHEDEFISWYDNEIARPEEGDTGIWLCCGPCPDFCYPGIPENARRDLAQPGWAAHRRGLRGSVPGPGRTAWLPVPGDGGRILCISPGTGIAGTGIAGTCVAGAAVFAVFACRICREEGAYEDTLQRD